MNQDEDEMKKKLDISNINVNQESDLTNNSNHENLLAENKV